MTASLRPPPDESYVHCLDALLRDTPENAVSLYGLSLLNETIGDTVRADEYRQAAEKLMPGLSLLHPDDLSRPVKQNPETAADPGDGSRENPYKIYTAPQLDDVRKNLSAHYILMDTIDLQGYDNWQPIGSDPENGFCGSLNGDGHRITHLQISGGKGPCGLFGYVDGAELKNIGILHMEVKGGEYVGGLVGSADSAMILSCSAAGRVRGTGFAGGLIGSAAGTSVSSSFAAGSVHGMTATGGLLGMADGVSITSGFASGSVRGTNNVGGMIGRAEGTSVSSSFAAGSVRGMTDTGGLLGTADGVSVTSSFASGSVRGTNNVGGLIGRAEGTTVITGFSAGRVQGKEFVGGLTGTLECSMVLSSFAAGMVSGEAAVGGVTGAAQDSLVRSGCALGKVSGDRNAGGVAGFLHNSSLTDCYAAGTADGDQSVGGIAGYALGGGVAFCYAAGCVRGTGEVGGLLGTAAGRVCISDSFALNPEVSGTENTGAVIGAKVAGAKITAETCFFVRIPGCAGVSKKYGGKSVPPATVWDTFPGGAWKGFDTNIWTANSGNANYCLPVLHWQKSLPLADARHLKE